MRELFYGNKQNSQDRHSNTNALRWSFSGGERFDLFYGIYSEPDLPALQKLCALVLGDDRVRILHAIRQKTRFNAWFKSDVYFILARDREYSLIVLELFSVDDEEDYHMLKAGGDVLAKAAREDGVKVAGTEMFSVCIVPLVAWHLLHHARAVYQA